MQLLCKLLKAGSFSLPLTLGIHMQLSLLEDVIVTTMLLVIYTRNKSIKKEECKKQKFV